MSIIVSTGCVSSENECVLNVGPTLASQWYLMLDLCWSNAGLMMVGQLCQYWPAGQNSVDIGPVWPNVGVQSGSVLGLQIVE